MPCPEGMVPDAALAGDFHSSPYGSQVVRARLDRDQHQVSPRWRIAAMVAKASITFCIRPRIGSVPQPRRSDCDQRRQRDRLPGHAGGRARCQGKRPVRPTATILGLPKVEDAIGKPLSPHAVTKYVNELYAEVFARCYGFNTI